MNLDHYIQLLNHKDSAQRRQAIIALGKSGDKRALQPLARVYKTDSDPELRDLALKAGRNIQKNAAAKPPEPKSESTDYFQFGFNEPPPPPQKPAYDSTPDWMQMAANSAISAPVKKISPADKQKAKSSLDRALDMSLKKDWDSVAHYLREALERDPDIEKNGTFMGLAVQVTHTNSGHAADVLRQMDTRKPGKAKKAKSPSYGHDEPGAGEFLVEWPIWLIILGLIFSGAAFFVLRSATDLFDEDFQVTSDTGETTYVDENGELVTVTQEGEVIESELSTQEIEDFVSEYGPITSLAFGFGISFFTMIFSLFNNYVTWFVGGFMGGSGSLSNFLIGTMRVDVVGNILTATLYALIVAAAASSASNPTTDPSQISSLQCVLGMAGIGLFGVKSWMVGQKHEFGLGMGVANVIVGAVATSIVGGCCYCGLISMLAGSVSSVQ